MSHPKPRWLPHATVISFLIIAVAFLYAACEEHEGVGTLKNEPPMVWLDGGPPEGGVSVYKIEFSWGGHDPDGSIDHFEYCITDNDGAFDPADTTGADKWTNTTATSDTFNFTADVPVDSVLDDQVAEFRRSHTFFVRSVDDRGLVSRETAYRSFTARTLSPEVTIVTPRYLRLNPAVVPPITTFRWVADDYISDRTTRQDPNWVSWILEPIASHNHSFGKTIEYIRNLPVDAEEWGDWVWYRSGDESGTSWTTAPMNPERYVFAIRAKDEAGAITPVFDEAMNVRRVLVSDEWHGPILTVRNPYFESVKTALCSTPLSYLHILVGVALGFEVTADASSYGGLEAGYRYGWDVANPDDPEQWDVDWTPFPPHPADEAPSVTIPSREFHVVETHAFRVEVKDEYGGKSCIEIMVDIIPFTMERNLLLVDDFVEGPESGWNNPVGKGVLPDDAEHDQFWEATLEDVEGFNPLADVWEVQAGAPISIVQLGRYKSIVWSVNGLAEPVLYDLIKFRPKDDGGAGYGELWANPLALYMAAGGHVLIAGQYPVTMSINADFTTADLHFPVVFLYDLDQRKHRQDQLPEVADLSGDESFPYRELCLETMEYAFVDATRWRDARMICRNDTRRTLDNSMRDHTMRAALPLDPAFSRLELRPEAAAPGKFYEPDQRGLDAEVYNPQYFADLCVYVPRHPRSCFDPIFGLDCLDTGEPVYGEPVAFWTSEFADKVADAPGAVGARSAVFGFPPVMCKPDQSKAAIEYVLFEEWMLPRAP
jgi:hypothetical protein